MMCEPPSSMNRIAPFQTLFKNLLSSSFWNLNAHSSSIHYFKIPVQVAFSRLLLQKKVRIRKMLGLNGLNGVLADFLVNTLKKLVLKIPRRLLCMLQI